MFYLLAADEATAPKSSNQWWLIIIMVVMLVGMMLISIIPQRKRQKKAQEMVDAIRVGTKVKTIGGFIGTVKMIDNNNKTFVLDISAQEDGSAMVTLDRSAIYMVMTPAVEGSIGTSAVAGGADAVAMDDAEMDADRKSVV